MKTEAIIQKSKNLLEQEGYKNIKLLKTFKSENKTNLILQSSSNRFLVQKKYTSNNKKEFNLHLKSYEYFKKNIKSFKIPKIIAVSKKDQILITDYIEGNDLRKIVKNQDKHKILKTLKKTGKKLKEFQTETKKDSKVLSHQDFRLWNILLSKKGKLFMIDTPKNLAYNSPYKDVADFLNSIYSTYISPSLLFKKKIRLERLERAFIEAYDQSVDYKKLYKYREKNFKNTIRHHPIYNKGKNYIKETLMKPYLWFFYNLKLKKIKNGI